MSDRIEKLHPGKDPFLDGPGEFLVKSVVELLREVPQFKLIFGEFIDGYKREDYGISNLPALRLYTNRVRKEFESWFITGDIVADIILPPLIRRTELQQLPDTLGNALLQQFRRPKFFNAANLLVPGLNELGKSFEIDKTLAYAVSDDEEELSPVTQLTINFRLDLREWDLYLERTNRTKDDPFEETLGRLERIVHLIQPLRDDQTVEPGVELGMDVKPGG